MRTWSRPLIIAVLLAVAVVALAGCTQREAPGYDPYTGSARFSEAISPFTLAFQCDVSPKAPKTGKITSIEPGSAACYDEQTDAGPRPQVAIVYAPTGSDKDGHAWPAAFACVTQDVAAKYKIGDKYP